MKEIELTRQERIRTLEEKEKAQVLGNIGSRHHQTNRKEK